MPITADKRKAFADALAALGAIFDDADIDRLLMLARAYPAFSTVNDKRLPFIIEARGNGKTLATIGGMLGLSRERVRQLIRKYEDIEGFPIEVRKIKRPKGPRVPRIEWRCPNCDTVYLDHPYKARMRKTQKLCGSCARNATRKVTDAVIEKAIAMRLEGIRWNRIADIFETSSQSIQRGIWKYLAKHDSLSYSQINEIWNATTYKNKQSAYNVWIKATGLEPRP